MKDMDTSYYNEEYHRIYNVHEITNCDADETMQMTNPIDKINLNTNTIDINNDQNVIKEHHNVELENEFASVVKAYLDDFDNLRKDNYRNIEKFAGNVVVFISYKNIKDIVIANAVNILEAFFLNENNSDIKVLYHTTKKKENSEINRYVNRYFRFIYQNFQNHFTNNKPNKNEKYTYKKKKNEHICDFADKYDASYFSSFLIRNNDELGHKNVIIDNCCKERHEYLILRKLLQCILIYSNIFENTLIFSIKNKKSDPETLIQKLSKIIDKNLDIFNEDNFKTYIAEIHKDNGIHQYRVNELKHDVKENCLKLNVLPYYKHNKDNDLICTLWPYSMFADMKISINKYVNVHFFNIDKKSFYSLQKVDINNLIIEVSNLNCSFEYAFFRTTEFCENEKIILKYFGVIIEQEDEIKNYKIWICSTYEYTKKNNIFICYNRKNVHQINCFFETLKNVHLINSNDEYEYLLIASDFHYRFTEHMTYYRIDFILLYHNTFFEILEKYFTGLDASGCKISITDDRQKHCDFYFYTSPISFYKIKENIVERMYMSETWRQFSINELQDLKTKLLAKTQYKISCEQYGHKYEFYLQTISHSDVLFKNNNDEYKDVRELHKKCIAFIEKLATSIKNKILDHENILGTNYNFEEFISFFFSENNIELHESLFLQSCLRKKFIKHELGVYFIVKFFENKLVDESTKKIWDENQKNSYAFIENEIFIYQYPETDLKEQCFLSVDLYFENVCKLCNFTETDRKCFFTIIETICDFYDSYEKELVAYKNTRKSIYEIIIIFPTYIPESLFNEFTKNLVDFKDKCIR